MTQLKNPPQLEPRACPFCGAEEKRVLFRQQFEAIADASLMSGYDVVVCRHCTAAYADGIPSQAAFDAYYRDMSKYEDPRRGGLVSPYDTARFNAIADLAQPYLPGPDCAILDIGCATAGLLAVLKQRGFSDLTGLDPSPTCAEIAKERYGIRVIAGTVPTTTETENKWDFIFLIGVLEHIRELCETLSWVRALLKPNGRVFIEVPDVLQFVRYATAPFQQLSVEHINFFSSCSLSNLMLRNGFGLVSVSQAVHELGHNTMDPTVVGVFQRDDVGPPGPLCTDNDQGVTALQEYLEQSRSAEERERRLMDELADRQEPFMVWGAGTRTQRLLATTRLGQAKISVFIDSNVKYQGKELRGIPIIQPADVFTRPEPILIASWTYQTEILRQLREELQLPNEVILLYGH